MTSRASQSAASTPPAPMSVFERYLLISEQI